MTNRQIVLDTETTGLTIEDDHRLIEVAGVELINRKLTGKTMQYYINPTRLIDPGAQAVHGISNEFLKDKPVFSELAPNILEFILGAELIIHNAPFDLGFLNHEYSKLKGDFKPIQSLCSITDTLLIARSRHAGQRNSLDALCKRYGIDNSKREYHGALLDSFLLAHVYLAMTGGQGSLFDTQTSKTSTAQGSAAPVEFLTKRYETKIIQANTSELEAHEKYLAMLSKNGKCIWRDNSTN